MAVVVHDLEVLVVDSCRLVGHHSKAYHQQLHYLQSCKMLLHR